MKKSKLLVAMGLVFMLGFTGCSSSDKTKSSGAEEATVTEVTETTEEAETTEEEGEVPADGVVVHNELPTPDDITIPEGQTIKVGYLAQNETDLFCVFMSNMLKAEAEKYNGQVIVEMADGQGVAATQLSQTENMIVKGMDVIILNAVDKDACAPAVQAVIDAGIPMIVLNTLVSNTDIATAYVGVDDEEAGISAMQIMGEALNGEGNFNVIEGILGHPATVNRMAGIEAELPNFPGITLGTSQGADFDRGKAMNVTEDWISGSESFDGIIALNDEMAVSAAKALASANITDVKVVGVDALDEALELIKAGEMYGTVYQDANGQGRGALNVAVASVLGMDLEKEYLIPFQKVTAENADDYMGLLSE